MSELRRADAALTEQDKTDIRRDLGLGTAAAANVPASGNAASGEVVKGNDTRLSDPRTPTTHSHTAAQVTDFAAAADARIAAASVNALADIDVTSPSVGQVLKWNGAAWVNDTDDTASGGGATNLSYTPSPTGGTVHSDTGADATVPLSDGTNAGLLAPAQHAKLAGVAANATANSSDATLLARANHTGTQAASTISDFSAAADARISAAVSVTVASAAQGTDAREWTAATVDQAEAEAGAATTRRAWTAQRVAQAIAAQVATWWTSISTAAGRALVTAADAAAQRTALGLGTAATTDSSAYATAAQGTDSREWTAATIDQAEAEAGSATTRRAWTAERVRQAIAAWWAGLTVGPSKITMATARLLGRTTAGSGAAEEIAVGSGLSLTAGTLSATGGGGSPGGSSGQLNFNDAGTFGGTSGISTNGTMLEFSANAASQTSAPIKFQGQYGDVWLGGYAGLLIVATGANLAASTNSRIGPLGVVIAPTGQIGFASSNTSALGGGATLAFSSITSGTAFEVNSGNPGAANRRDLALRRLIATEGVQLTAATVGTLPAAASNAYLSAPVSDASAPTLQTTVAAGGSARAVVRSNGTNWIVVEVL